MRRDGDLRGAAHRADLGAALEQTQIVQQVIEADELVGRMVSLAPALTQRRDPGEQPLIEIRVGADRVVDAFALLDDAGQDFVDVGDRKRVIGAERSDCAFGPGAGPVPDCARRVALTTEQDELAVGTTGHEDRNRVRFAKPGQIQEVAVLTEKVLAVAIPHARRRRGQDGNSALAHHPHQLAPALGEFFRIQSLPLNALPNRRRT